MAPVGSPGTFGDTENCEKTILCLLSLLLYPCLTWEPYNLGKAPKGQQLPPPPKGLGTVALKENNL